VYRRKKLVLHPQEFENILLNLLSRLKKERQQRDETKQLFIIFAQL